MSHARGEVLRDGETIAWFEYDGTGDLPRPKLYPSREALGADWRSADWPECTCGAEPVPVVLRADYGSGIEWPSTVCLHCNCIVDCRDPYDVLYGEE